MRAGVRACVRAGFGLPIEIFIPTSKSRLGFVSLKGKRNIKKKKDSPFLRRRHRMGGRAIEVIIPGDGTNGDSRGRSGSDVQFRGGFASARGRDRPL